MPDQDQDRGIERRLVARAGAIEIREAAAGGPRKLAGLAAVYYREAVPGTEYEVYPPPSGLRERIMPGAFADALARGRDVICAVDHWTGAGRLLGRLSAKTLRLSDAPDGLRYEVDLPDTQAARDLAELIKRGDVAGSSFSFRATREERKAGGAL